MSALADLIRSFVFVEMLAPAQENEAGLQRWMTRTGEVEPPYVHSFTRGLDLDIHTGTAAFTLPHHEGRTEEVNTERPR